MDVYRTVFELKTKLESMVKIPANRMRLFYIDQVRKKLTFFQMLLLPRETEHVNFQELRSTYGPEEMLYPNKQLYRYNIRNGDEIIIDSKLNRFCSQNSSTPPQQQQSSIRSWACSCQRQNGACFSNWVITSLEGGFFKDEEDDDDEEE